MFFLPPSLNFRAKTLEAITTQRQVQLQQRAVNYHQVHYRYQMMSKKLIPKNWRSV